MKTEYRYLSFILLLTFLFVCLKIEHSIEWSWFWVLSPLLAGASVGVWFLLMIGIFIVMGTSKYKEGSEKGP